MAERIMSDKENEGLTYSVTYSAWLLEVITEGQEHVQFNTDLMIMIKSSWKQIQKALQQRSLQFRIFRA